MQRQQVDEEELYKPFITVSSGNGRWAGKEMVQSSTLEKQHWAAPVPQVLPTMPRTASTPTEREMQGPRATKWVKEALVLCSSPGDPGYCLPSMISNRPLGNLILTTNPVGCINSVLILWEASFCQLGITTLSWGQDTVASRAYPAGQAA